MPADPMPVPRLASMLDKHVSGLMVVVKSRSVQDSWGIGTYTACRAGGSTIVTGWEALVVGELGDVGQVLCLGTTYPNNDRWSQIEPEMTVVPVACEVGVPDVVDGATPGLCCGDHATTVHVAVVARGSSNNLESISRVRAVVVRDGGAIRAVPRLLRDAGTPVIGCGKGMYQSRTRTSFVHAGELALVHPVHGTTLYVQTPVDARFETKLAREASFHSIKAAAKEAAIAAAIAEPDSKWTEDDREAMQRLPIPYLLGKARFAGLEFTVTNDVLVPRVSSEPLVDAAVAALAARQLPVTVVDLGTGSGCLIVAVMAKLFAAGVAVDAVRGVGVDISPQALAVARQNALALLPGEADITFVEGDFAALDVLGLTGVDVVVCNPPYLASRAPTAYDAASTLVAEPEIAVVASEAGRGAYLALAAAFQRTPDFLARTIPGELVLEVGGHHRNESIAAEFAPQFEVVDELVTPQGAARGLRLRVCI